MATKAVLLVRTDIKACTGLILTSPNHPSRWLWTAKIMHNGELDDAWKSDKDFRTADAAIKDCYSFLRSMDLSPGPVEEL